MESVINFLTNNYIWLIVITLILFFSLIGYLVENGKEIDNEEIKSEKKDKNKKKKKEKIDPVIMEDNVPTVEEAMKMEEEKKVNDVNKENKSLEEKLESK